MGLQAKSGRRSTFSLMSPEPNSELSAALQGFRKSCTIMQRLSETNMEISEELFKWSLKEENCAIRDIAFQLNELVIVLTEFQKDFFLKLLRTSQQLEIICENQKSLVLAKKELDTVAAKEAKLSKELKKNSPWKKGGDIKLLERQLQHINAARIAAEAKLSETRAELEAVKMMQFKLCMLKLTEAHLEMCSANALVFDAQREILLQIPDVSTQSVLSMQYGGAPVTQRIVADVREQLLPKNGNANFVRGCPRRVTVDLVCRSGGNNAPQVFYPPPPYTPTAPPASPRRSLPLPQNTGMLLCDAGLYPQL